MTCYKLEKLVGMLSNLNTSTSEKKRMLDLLASSASIDTIISGGSPNANAQPSISVCVDEDTKNENELHIVRSVVAHYLERQNDFISAMRLSLASKMFKEMSVLTRKSKIRSVLNLVTMGAFDEVKASSSKYVDMWNDPQARHAYSRELTKITSSDNASRNVFDLGYEQQSPYIFTDPWDQPAGANIEHNINQIGMFFAFAKDLKEGKTCELKFTFMDGSDEDTRSSQIVVQATNVDGHVVINVAPADNAFAGKKVTWEDSNLGTITVQIKKWTKLFQQLADMQSDSKQSGGTKKAKSVISKATRQRLGLPMTMPSHKAVEHLCAHMTKKELCKHAKVSENTNKTKAELAKLALSI
jgi:hypothetical protein